MSEKPHFVILSVADDWEGLYVNKDLITEGHRITVSDILAVAESFGLLSYDEIEDWNIIDSESGDGCPETLPEKHQ